MVIYTNPAGESIHPVVLPAVPEDKAYALQEFLDTFNHAAGRYCPGRLHGTDG